MRSTSPRPDRRIWIDRCALGFTYRENPAGTWCGAGRGIATWGGEIEIPPRLHRGHHLLLRGAAPVECLDGGAVSKYKNIPQRVDGHFFHSKKEARRYTELKLMQEAGVISNLELQPKFRIEINGILICNYFADFRYYDNERNAEIVEDVKGIRTAIYRLKKRLMKAVHDIQIEET